MSEDIREIEDWDIVVKPKVRLFELNLKELWGYRDLIGLMVKRDLTAVYKQTILGPVWMFIQPIFVTLIYTFTFGQAKLSTDNIPPLLFYLMGQTFWTYFADCLNKTSTTFIANASVFGKVYFPRLVMPIAAIISNLLKLLIQVLLLTAFYIYFYTSTDVLQIQWSLFVLIPVIIIFMGLFGLSLGIMFSSLTTKYRDFTFLLTFAIQLIMFLSCVVFPASMFSGLKQSILLCNPIGGFLELIKFILTGHGTVVPALLGVNVSIVIITLFFSVLLFNRTEKSFMDTV